MQWQFWWKCWDQRAPWGSPDFFWVFSSLGVPDLLLSYFTVTLVMYIVFECFLCRISLLLPSLPCRCGCSLRFYPLLPQPWVWRSWESAGSAPLGFWAFSGRAEGNKEASLTVACGALNQSGLLRPGTEGRPGYPHLHWACPAPECTLSVQSVRPHWTRPFEWNLDIFPVLLVLGS